MNSLNTVLVDDTECDSKTCENSEMNKIIETKSISINDKHLNDANDILPNVEIENKENLQLIHLNDDILIEIFTYLPSEDLLSSTLVCKKFNHLISNSRILLNTFSIKFTESKKKKLWIGSRKYSRIEIKNIQNAQFMKIEEIIMKSIGESITDLTINCSSNYIEFLWRILLISVNLKNLDLIVNLKDADVNIPQNPAPKLRLNILRLGFVGIFNKLPIFEKLFSDCEVKEFVPCHMCDDNFTYNFIKNQHNLESFHMLEPFFFNRDDLNFDFKLKTLITPCYIIDKCEVNFIKFLDSQKDSIEELHLHKISDNIAKVLNQFTRLRKLNIRGGLSPKFHSETVESFTVNERTLISANQLPNLKKLEIDFGAVPSIVDFKFLEQLTLSSLNLAELNTGSVKKLKLHFVGRSSSFKFEAPHLEELEIIDQRLSLNFLPKYLKNRKTNLKKIKIECNFMEQEMKDEIMKNISKVDKFELRIKKN